MTYHPASNPYAAPQQPRFVSDIRGELELVTASSALAVDVEKVKKQARIDDDADDAMLQDELIPAATRHIEQLIPGHRQLLQTTWDLPLLCWWEGELSLPRPPLSSVTSIKYFDSNGTEQTLDSSIYIVRTPTRAPGKISRAPLKTWPALQTDRLWPITIRFVAGYGTASSDIPITLRQAIVMQASYWYLNPAAFEAGTTSKDVEDAIERIAQSENWGSYK